jgi:hypothetical protein
MTNLIRSPAHCRHRDIEHAKASAAKGFVQTDLWEI